MDEHFANLLAAAEIRTEAELNAYGAACDAVTEALTDPRVARLVGVAHGDDLDHEQDRWFWEPFRAADSTFLTGAEGAALHRILADVCLRSWLSNEGDELAAVLIRLAQLDGRRAATEHLWPVAAGLLAEGATMPPPPRTGTPSTIADVHAQRQKQAAEDEEVEHPPEPLTPELVADIASEQIAQLSKQLAHVAQWAQRAHGSFDREQAIVGWVLSGVRSDGAPWASLSPASVAVAAAQELASLVGGVPSANHEKLLRLVQAAATGEGAAAADSPLHTEGTTPPPEDIKSLVPVHVAIAEGADLAERFDRPEEVGQRMLWEACAIALWNRA